MIIQQWLKLITKKPSCDTPSIGKYIEIIQIIIERITIHLQYLIIPPVIILQIDYSTSNFLLYWHSTACTQVNIYEWKTIHFWRKKLVKFHLKCLELCSIFRMHSFVVRLLYRICLLILWANDLLLDSICFGCKLNFYFGNCGCFKLKLLSIIGRKIRDLAVREVLLIQFVFHMSPNN